VAQLGAPEAVYEHPATPFVARFVGRTSVLTGRVEASGEHRVLRVGAAAIPVPPTGSVAPGASAMLMIRPQYVFVADTAAADGSTTEGSVSVVGRIAKRVYIGDIAQLEIAGDGFTLLAERGTAEPSWRALQIGQPVRATWPAAAMLVFPGDTDREP
jgi:ABC-type Fe3+/spermidine/putrescine transport system ATPase subunit